MTSNQPNRSVEVSINPIGIGMVQVDGLNWSEIEMVTMAEGDLGYPSALPRLTNSVYIQVLGAIPDSKVTVHFYSPHGPVAEEKIEVPVEAADSVAEPEPEPVVEEEPEAEEEPAKTADELVEAHTRDELEALAKDKGIEVKSSDNKHDIAKKLVN